jgi:hypothetical protein
LLHRAAPDLHQRHGAFLVRHAREIDERQRAQRELLWSVGRVGARLESPG